MNDPQIRSSLTKKKIFYCQLLQNNYTLKHARITSYTFCYYVPFGAGLALSCVSHTATHAGFQLAPFSLFKIRVKSQDVASEPMNFSLLSSHQLCSTTASSYSQFYCENSRASTVRSVTNYDRSSFSNYLSVFSEFK